MPDEPPPDRRGSHSSSNGEAEQVVVQQPPLPFRPSVLWDRHDGMQSSLGVLYGIITRKATSTSGAPYTHVFCPLYQTTFISHNPKDREAPLLCFVKFQIDGGRKFGNNDIQRAKFVRALNRDQLDKLNRDRPSEQTWAYGTISNFDSYNKIFSISVKEKGFPPKSIAFSPTDLAPGSKIPPLGSPVRFQTARESTGSKGKSVVTAVLYDQLQFGAHMGLLPDRSFIETLETEQGHAHFIIGSTVIADQRAVSLLDLLKKTNNITSLTFSEILSLAEDILLERYRTSGDNLVKEELQEVYDALNEKRPLNVHVHTSFFKRGQWLRLINKYFHTTDTSDLVVQNVTILERLDHHLGINEINVKWKAGLATRHVERWRCADHQSAQFLIYSDKGFKRLSLDNSYDQFDPQDVREEFQFQLNLEEQPHQASLLAILLVKSSPNNDAVPVIEYPANAVPSFRPEVDSSLLITYRKNRAREASDLLNEVLPENRPPVLEVGHPDKRFLSYRCPLPGLSANQLTELVNQLNAPELKFLVHAAEWDILDSDVNDDKVRVLLGRSGYSPPVELLLQADPLMRVRGISHGLCRISSTLTTAELSAKLAKINQASREINGDRASKGRDSSLPLQALIDNVGIHWIGQPAKPPPGGVRGWNLPANDLPLPPMRQRVVIEGPLPVWNEKMLGEVFSQLGVATANGKRAFWANLGGRLVIIIEDICPHDLIHESFLFKNSS